MLARLLVVLACLALPAGVQATPRTIAEARAVDAAFVSGLDALDAGSPKRAIPVFLSILAAHPDLLRVRLELARAYFVDEQWSNARREFLLVLSGDLPDSVRGNVLPFIRAIDTRRGFDWNLSVSLAELRSNPDYRTDTIDLLFGGVALPFTLDRADQSELGLSFSASATWRRDLSALSRRGLSFSVFGGVFAHGDHARTEALRDVSYGLRGGLQLAAARTTASATLSATRRDDAGAHFEDRTGLTLALERRTETGLSFYGTTRFARVDNVRSDGLDGSSVFGEVGLRRSVAGRAMLGASLFGEARGTEQDFESYDRFGLMLFGSVETNLGLSIRPSLTFARKGFREPNPLYVGNPDERELTGRVRIEKTDLILGNGFSPFLELEARYLKSGIEAFSHRSGDLRVGFRRVF